MDLANGSASPHVTVPRLIYDDLVRQKEEYHRLREALVGSGMKQETIDLMVARSPQSVDPVELPPPWRASSISSHRQTNSTGSTVASDEKNDQCSPEQDNPRHARSWRRATLSEPGPSRGPYQGQTILDTSNDERRRTVFFTGLPPDVVHRDVTNAIVGGPLIQVWVDKNSRTADATFAWGAAAYIAYAAQNPIYIKSTRVAVSWADRQFVLDNATLHAIKDGALSRNFVLRRAADPLMEQSIRRDMAHIHNLFITAVVTVGDDVFVSTNSALGARYAVTCMRSRFPYRAFTIEWYPDECNQPLPPRSLNTPPRTPVAQLAVPAAPVTNNDPIPNAVPPTETPKTADSPGSASFADVRPRMAAHSVPVPHPRAVTLSNPFDVLGTDTSEASTPNSHDGDEKRGQRNKSK